MILNNGTEDCIMPGVRFRVGDIPIDDGPKLNFGQWTGAIVMGECFNKSALNLHWMQPRYVSGDLSCYIHCHLWDFLTLNSACLSAPMSMRRKSRRFLVFRCLIRLCTDDMHKVLCLWIWVYLCLANLLPSFVATSLTLNQRSNRPSGGALCCSLTRSSSAQQSALK